MTIYLLIAAVLLIMVSGATILALAVQIERQRLQLAALRVEYESERAWADVAEADAAALRRQLATAQHWNQQAMIPVLGGAWRAGLGKSGQYR